MVKRAKLTELIPLRVTLEMAADLEVAAAAVDLERPALVRIYIAEGLQRREQAKMAQITPEEAMAVVTARNRGLDPIAALTAAYGHKLEVDAGDGNGSEGLTGKDGAS